MTIPHALKTLIVLGVIPLFAACTHLKGVVVDDITNRPVPGAVFTVGHPSGVGVSARYPVDADGRFDFSIAPIDEDFLYLTDPRSPGESSVRRVDRSELGTNMRIRLHQTPANSP